MLKQLFFGIAAVLVTSTVCAQAYKWVDEDGVVHYSDRPHPGAEQIQLPSFGRSSATTRAPVPTTRRAPAASAATAPATEPTPFSYETLEVSSPAAEETLWNIEGVLNVTVTLQPGLQQGHQVRVYFDGTPRIVSGTSFQIEEVYRGVHNLQVEVLDAAGKLLIRSLPNRFYVQANAIG
jgi:hypothetical protein